MINLSLDLSDVEKKFSLLTSDLMEIKSVVLSDLTQTIYEAWQQQARQELNSVRKDYINGLRIIEEGRFTNSIVLFGKLNNMIESGAPPFDMKKGFENSPKIKISKKGNWYLVIPFKFSSGKGNDGQLNMPIIPKDIMNILNRSKQITVKNLPNQYKPTKRGAIGEYGEYQRKTSIYMGMTKNTAMYKKTVQSTYSNFRIVGRLSDPNSWIHPGFEAKNLAQKAVNSVNIQTMVEESVNRELINLGY